MIRRAWRAILAASGREDQILKQDYCTMSRKLYLTMKVQARESDIDADDCVESSEEDWLDDARGEETMDWDHFFQCWFQAMRSP